MHQKQLTNSNCGQTCIAIITGRSQWDAMHAVGNDQGTQPKHLQEALFKFGYDVERQRFKKKEPPKLAIALVRSTLDKSYGHAVVIKEGEVLDPAFGRPVELATYLELITNAGRHIAGLIVVKGRRF